MVKCIIRQALLLGAERDARVELTEAGLVKLPRTLLVQREIVANAKYVRESLSMNKYQSIKSAGFDRAVRNDHMQRHASIMSSPQKLIFLAAESLNS